MNEIYQTQVHGRVNLMGEHTDYNGGWVLPTLIPQSTTVTLKKRTDNIVILKSDQGREIEYSLGDESSNNSWTDYLQGATYFLRNYKISGFEAEITSTIPEGSGLSSSAALEISFLRALKESFKLEMSDIELAQLGQKIENEFAGAHVGIMDQMAVTLASLGEALFLDTQQLTYERLKLPHDQMDLLVLNSGISHRLGLHDGGYNQRRFQCDEICQMLKIKSLRELSLNDLKRVKLPDLLMKRARHVITENDRVKRACEKLKANELKAFGEIFYESHESMKNDYEISLPEIDYLIELCKGDPDVFGARLSGGGFGGSIVALTSKNQAQRIADELILRYRQSTGLEAKTLVAGLHEYSIS